MAFIFILIVILFVFEYNGTLDTGTFFKEVNPLFKFLRESDYEFLVRLRYGDDANIEKLFSDRVKNGLIVLVGLIFIFLSNMSFINILVAFIGGFLVFKMPYTNLKNYYKNNLYQINLMLPYYLKSLEILVQHYTVPVALARSIETAPQIFKSGLRTLVDKIEAGDSSVDPYMDFAKEYPVRDSMRMMRLLYRLGLGDQENKQEQLTMFSKTVSSLQNKSREQKYKDRLEKMEKKTMVMLMGTGGGIMLLLMLSMTMMMGI